MNDIIPAEDKRPLPLIVAEKWNFPLAHHEIDGEFWYSILDWIKGLTSTIDSKEASNAWRQVKFNLNQRVISNNALTENPVTFRSLDYRATDGKRYKRDFTNDMGLYRITQELRDTKKRPLMEQIKEYLAKAGVLVDVMRREPDTIINTLSENPDMLVEAAIEAYRKQGRDDDWISKRLAGKISRKKFTDALREAIQEALSPRHYSIATDDVYKGLWNRTAAKLREQLGIKPTQSLRAHQPSVALYYQGIAEETIAHYLRKKETLSWIEARIIVKEIAHAVRMSFQHISHYWDTDIATGQPLMTRQQAKEYRKLEAEYYDLEDDDPPVDFVE